LHEVRTLPQILYVCKPEEKSTCERADLSLFTIADHEGQIFTPKCRSSITSMARNRFDDWASKKQRDENSQ
jgi:hypothetical protein